jgi:hypothetical protein
MEELKEAGFDSTYCLTLVQDKNFYSGSKQDGIYAYFRGNDPVHGEIVKPTGKRDEIICIDGSYKIIWVQCTDMMYYLQQIGLRQMAKSII